MEPKDGSLYTFIMCFIKYYIIKGIQKSHNKTYLRVRDCCECFLYKYTHALIVRTMNEKFQYSTRRSRV
jgi:hypothetical protein